MPRYWFTTHWPRFQTGHDTLQIYIQRPHRDYVQSLGAHDRVLIYEFKTGPNRIGRDGKIERRVPGRQGIICEAEVLTPLKSRPPEIAHEKYTNGKSADWAWMAETGDRHGGLLAREHVNALLGYAAGNNFRGFNAGRGIIEITPEEHAKVMAELSSL